MRIVRIQVDKKNKYGVVENNLVNGYRGTPFASLKTGKSNFRPDGTTYRLDIVKLLAPSSPSKIICLGVNYRSHALEFNSNIPTEPLIFLKPPTAVIGPEENIVLPHKRRIDYECELAMVISKKGKDIIESKAKDYILGYTCFNDISDRGAQKTDVQWTRAKGYDTFAAIGPWIETGVQPENLLVETYLNNKVKQSARTSDLVFGVSKLVSFISKIMTLLPGDIIATGTPAGVGPMKAGDIVQIKIEKIGTLRNYVVDK